MQHHEHALAMTVAGISELYKYFWWAWRLQTQQFAIQISF
jgi:hypothetical protein